ICARHDEEWTGRPWTKRRLKPHRDYLVNQRHGANSDLLEGITVRLALLYLIALAVTAQTPDPSPTLSGSGGSGTVTHTRNLTANQPLFGNGTGDIKVGTKSGNTNEVVTTTGSQTSGAIVAIDSNGNHVPVTGSSVSGTGITTLLGADISTPSNPSAGTTKL